MFSASIGVDVMVTGTVGDGVVLFRVGDGGDGKFVISVDWTWGFGTWILKESLCVIDGWFVPRVTSIVSVIYVNALGFWFW